MRSHNPADQISAPITDPSPPKRRRRRWPWVVGAGLLILCVLHVRGWSTQPLTLADGRRFDVLNFDRHVSYGLQSDGRRTERRYFWVRYYATSSDSEAMLAEARSLAPALYPIADSLGFELMQLSPSHPILVRWFPLGVVSTNIEFARDSSGAWSEVRP